MHMYPVIFLKACNFRVGIGSPLFQKGTQCTIFWRNCSQM